MKTTTRLPKQTLTTTQAAAILGVNIRTIRKMDKELKPFLVGSRKDRRYNSEVIYDYKEGRK